MTLQNLHLIEIELFSYCNRKCIWCPNNHIDRTQIQYLNQSLLIQLIDELKKNNYQNYISFSRYNEPLSQIAIFKAQVAYIKSQLPDATLVTNTNGDFLFKESLNGLFIDELTIMDYDNRGLEFCVDKLRECECEILEISYPYIYAQYNTMKILYYVDWPKHSQINDRGGSLTQYSVEQRNRPCFEPMYFIGVNYDGTLSPCCNIRNDITKHQNYIFGNLQNNSLNDVLQSNEYNVFVNSCAAGYFEKNSPCYYCQNTGGRYTRNKGGIAYE